MMKLSELAYFTDDVPAMVSYYRTLLGAEPVAESEGMAIFEAGPVKVLIHKTYTPEEGGLAPRDHAAYAVDDVDATCNDLASKGLTIDVAPRDFDWGRAAYLTDPDGHLIELTQNPQ